MSVPVGGFVRSRYHYDIILYPSMKRVGTQQLHCKKKVSDFSVPSLDVPNQILSGRESLVSDIPAGDGKIIILFTV